MEQVKIFRNGSEKELEKEVNEWLKINDHIEIVERLQSQSLKHTSDYVTSISIWYKFKEDQKPVPLI